MPDYDFNIDTPRLALSYFNASLDSHCDFLVELFNSPEVKAASGGTAVSLPDREAARRNIESKDERIERLGYGRYLVFLKQPAPDSDNSGQPTDRPFSERSKSYTKIGFVSMELRTHIDSPQRPDLGFYLLKRYYGRGYATEAAQALTRYFEEEKGVSEFLGFCNPDNEQSKGMFRRLGYEERGVRKVKGLAPNGNVVEPLIWSKGLKKSLEEVGL